MEGILLLNLGGFRRDITAAAATPPPSPHLKPNSHILVYIVHINIISPFLIFFQYLLRPSPFSNPDPEVLIKKYKGHFPISYKNYTLKGKPYVKK